MKNSSFWISLLAFILLMCSCRTKKVDSNARMMDDIQSELSYLKEYVKIDTFKTAYFAKEIQNVVIEEVITAIEYDKESGKPIKETNTNRKTTQGSDKVVSEERQRGAVVTKNDSLNHIADISKKVESESETVTESNGLKSFGKWFGIVTGLSLVIFFIILYLKKSRVN